ncbi:hypothetical protein [Bacillus kwashiorkori]|uniref:hypothetical protein n=1 Tax=Bacillus kwashiorkori TaxID=1522318 RepID=UPI000781BE4C|nr:hypothetical protein [Bacillus kwashiorkori]
MLNNNKKYGRYLIEEYQPAQDWYKKPNSREWIERNIPTLHELLEKGYGKLHSGVYCILLNDVPVYVGEALKLYDRLKVHAHNLYRKPLDYFGVEEEEINSSKVKIQVKILKEDLPRENLRKENELLWIKKLKPLLQKNDGTDLCIPRRNRRKVIEKELISKQNVAI